MQRCGDAEYDERDQQEAEDERARNYALGNQFIGQPWPLGVRSAPPAQKFHRGLNELE